MGGRERESYQIVQIEHRRVWLFELPLFNRISFHFVFSNSRFLLKFLREHVFFYTERLIERFSLCQKHTINANLKTKKATGRKTHQRLTIITNNNWNQQIMRQDVCNMHGTSYCDYLTFITKIMRSGSTQS
jgi:hypothetical protein